MTARPLGNPPFRLLLAARTVSRIGDSLSLVALMLHVAATTGQALAVALLLLAGDVVPALLGPLAGTVSDRFALRHVMVASELVQGALLVALAVWLPPLPLLLVLAGLRALAGQVFQPASRAAVPALAGDAGLERANAAIGAGTNIGETLGPLLAAALLPWLGIRGVLLGDAVSFLVSAALLAGLPVLPRAALAGSFLSATAEGLRAIARQPVVRSLTAGFSAVVACNGIYDVALVFLATCTLGAGPSAAGLLLGAAGTGLLAGYALLTRVRAALPVLLLTGFAVSSLGNLLTGLAWAVAAAFGLQAVRGLGIAAMDVAATTIIQREVPAGLQGRVFGGFNGAVGLAAALAYLCGGVLLDLTSPRAAFVTAGACGLLATLGTGIALARSRR